MVSPFTAEETKARKRNITDLPKVTQLGQGQNSESGYMGFVWLGKGSQVPLGKCLNFTKSQGPTDKTRINSLGKLTG